MKQIDSQLARFGEHTASFVCQVLGAEWGCFYHLDCQGQPFGFKVHRTPWALRAAYLQHHVEQYDPLHPATLAQHEIRFVSVFDSRLPGSLQDRRNYWNFLAGFGSRDAAEMVFWVRDRPVAGLSLVWVGKSAGGSDRQRGEAVQSYVEFNLASHYGPPSRSHADPGAAPQYDFTDREWEIVQLVCQGSTNAQIAQRLNIGLATVKTHLIHVFEKCAVDTRAALVSRVLSQPARAHA
jgi:DNA-binding CsgD family transcriptional regulator